MTHGGGWIVVRLRRDRWRRLVRCRTIRPKSQTSRPRYFLFSRAFPTHLLCDLPRRRLLLIVAAPQVLRRWELLRAVSGWWRSSTIWYRRWCRLDGRGEGAGGRLIVVRLVAPQVGDGERRSGEWNARHLLLFLQETFRDQTPCCSWGSEACTHWTCLRAVRAGVRRAAKGTARSAVDGSAAEMLEWQWKTALGVGERVRRRKSDDPSDRTEGGRSRSSSNCAPQFAGHSDGVCSAASQALRLLWNANKRKVLTDCRALGLTGAE